MNVEKILVTLKHIEMVEMADKNGSTICRLVKDLQMKKVVVTVERNLNHIFSYVTFEDGSILRFNRNILDKREPSVVLRDTNYLS
ncbi:hypothetical protein VmeM32_00222 [Vibrio phage vB_VmeM-32]|nr:hypothetical protein VmeM32_00222 [Vibrio phage vB_VmeM-32]